MGKLQDLKIRGAIGLDVSPVTNSLMDSVTGTPATVSGTAASWGNTKHGRGIRFGSGSFLTVADSAANRLVGSGWLVVSGKFDKWQGIASRFISKRNAGGTNYELYRSSATTLRVYDGTTESVFTLSSPLNATVLAVHFLGAGLKPELWIDGACVAQGSVAITLTGYAANVNLGNLYGGAYWNPNPTTRFIVINDGINVTNKDISELSAELMAERGALRDDFGGWAGSLDIDKTALVEISAEKTADGKLLDLTGNGRDGILVAGGVTSRRNGFGAYSSKGVGSAAKSPIPACTTGMTIEFFGSVNSAGANFSQLLGSVGNAAAIYSSITSGALFGQMFFPGVGNFATGSFTPKFRELMHVVLRWKSGEKLQLFIDNVLVGESATAITNTLTGFDAWQLAKYSSGITCDLDMIKGRIYGRRITDGEIAVHYNQFASHPLHSNDYSTVYPTLADVTSGEIGNSGFLRNTGTWKVSQDSNKKKWIENVAVGTAYKRDRTAFGTKAFEMRLSSLAGENSISFAASAVGGYAAYAGYALYAWSDGSVGVLKCTGGGSAALFRTAAGYVGIGVGYLIAMTRTAAGVIKAYIKGGAYASWTLMGTGVADLAYTTSAYANLSTYNVGTKFRHLGTHQGALGIPELTALYG